VHILQINFDITLTFFKDTKTAIP